MTHWLKRTACFLKEKYGGINSSHGNWFLSQRWDDNIRDRSICFLVSRKLFKKERERERRCKSYTASISDLFSSHSTQRRTKNTAAERSHCVCRGAENNGSKKSDSWAHRRQRAEDQDGYSHLLLTSAVENSTPDKIWSSVWQLLNTQTINCVICKEVQHTKLRPNPRW